MTRSHSVFSRLARSVAWSFACVAIPIAVGAAQWSSPFDLGASTRLRPSPDQALRLETGVRATTRPTVIDGFGALVSGGMSSVARNGSPVAWRTDLRAGPRLEYGPTEVAVLAGVSRLAGVRDDDEVHTAAVVLRQTVGDGALTLMGERTAYDALRQTIHDTVYLVAGFPFHSTTVQWEPRRQQYAQVAADMSWRFGPVTSTVTAGARSVREGAPERWGSVSALVSVAPGAVLVGEVGRIASVPEQHLPAARFASITLRFGGGPRLRATPAAERGNERDADRADPDIAATRVDVVRDSTGVTGLRIAGLTAARVELMSDVTDWSPVELRNVAGNQWHLALRVPAGVHRVVIRVDGGEWQPPPDLPTERSEFGERVGLLLVRP